MWYRMGIFVLKEQEARIPSAGSMTYAPFVRGGSSVRAPQRDCFKLANIRDLTSTKRKKIAKIDTTAEVFYQSRGLRFYFR